MCLWWSRQYIVGPDSFVHCDNPGLLVWGIFWIFTWQDCGPQQRTELLAFNVKIHFLGFFSLQVRDFISWIRWIGGQPTEGWSLHFEMLSSSLRVQQHLLPEPIMFGAVVLSHRNFLGYLYLPCTTLNKLLYFSNYNFYFL